MTGYTLALHDGTVAHPYSVKGLHLLADVQTEHGWSFTLLDESQVVDCERFREVWRQLGGSCVDAEGLDLAF